MSKDNHSHWAQFRKAASSVDRNQRSRFSPHGATPSLDTCSHSFHFFFKIFLILIYFWLYFIAVHGLSLVAVSGGYSLVAVHVLLISVASLVAEHRF